MRLQKKEIYNILKNARIITNQKCKNFDSTTYKSSHWLNNIDGTKIWANGQSYIAIEFCPYDEEGMQKKVKEIILIKKDGEWIKYLERSFIK